MAEKKQVCDKEPVMKWSIRVAQKDAGSWEGMSSYGKLRQIKQIHKPASAP